MSREVDVKALVSHIVRGDGLDRCRICMGDTSEGQVHLDDTVMMDGDKPITLAELLESVTGVQVPLEDHLPQLLCCDCSMLANAAADLRTMCYKTAKKWDDTISLLNHIDSELLKGTKIIAILNGDTITIKEECKMEEPEVPKLKKPVVKIANAKRHDCQCRFCDKRFLYAHHLTQHLKESSDYQRACHICAEVMSRELLIQHLRKVHKTIPYVCKKCPAMFRTHKKYKSHLATGHSGGACTCGDCGRSFHTSQAYCAHISIHVPKTCPSCEKVYRNQKCYQYHVKKCCDLDKHRTDAHQTKHKITVPVKKKNKAIKVGLRGSADTECYCDYCNKKFAGKKFVAAHIQIVHTKDTHRPCTYCGKLLAAAHMSTHLKKHESNETFKCDHCGIVLKTKLGYVQHVRLHTGERPYRCQYCEETFSASSRRSEHVRRAHSTDPTKYLKHACQFCPAQFRLPFRLRTHVKNVHGEGKQSVQFECNVCHQKFNSCRGLLHHNRKHQPVSNKSNIVGGLTEST